MIQLYAVKDLASKTTQHPFPMECKRDAIDGLRRLANDSSTTIYNHPNDFELWYLGEYDQRNMEFHIDPSRIITAAELQVDENA